MRKERRKKTRNLTQENKKPHAKEDGNMNERG
jgi:hypothetical protein